MRTYSELTLEERVEIRQRLESGDCLRAVGRSPGRAPGMISRERRRGGPEGACYKAQTAHRHSQRCRTKPRVLRKLDDPALWETVQALLRAQWSPSSILGWWADRHERLRQI